MLSPNLAPQIHKTRSKNVARTPYHVDLIFALMFDRFYSELQLPQLRKIGKYVVLYIIS